MPASNLVTPLRRIARMHPHEIYIRVRQKLSSRIDELRYLSGLAPAQPARETRATPGAFFFDPAEAPSLARAWAQRNPSAVTQILHRAERVAAHKFPLLGYRDLDFGVPIDWQFDPVNRVRAPLVPWRRVPYLDFRAAGDHKVVWELSRHQHLMTLVRAWLFTGEERWVTETIGQWHHWQQANPYPLGINWTSSLEVAFRILSWMWIDHWLAAADCKPFRQELAIAIGHGARYIERYLSTYFAPNTHLLGEAVALFFAGAFYPQFRDARRWREQGWKLVLEQARVQVRPDGFHFEQSVYYHVYALDFFLHTRLLAARNAMHSAELDATILRMAEALWGISQTGCAPRFGDDDGGRLFDPSRNHSAHMLDPLALAAVLFGRREFKVCGEFTEEAWWLLGPAGAEAFDKHDDPLPSIRSTAAISSGYYSLAANGALLVADAGPHGWGRAGHGHADALSVQLSVDRQALLTDPGAGAYPVELPLRNRLRGTSAHSTLEIDGLSQADPSGSFAWTHHPRLTVEHWRPGRSVDLFAASHDGYQRLPHPILHRRWIVGWQTTGWLVRDVALGRGRHRFDLRWRLSPEAEHLPSTAFVFRWPAGASLRIAPARELGWHSHIEQAEFSPVYGEVLPSPVLHFSCEREAPAEAAALLLPCPAATEATLRCLSPGPSPALYEWQDRAGVRYLWFADEPAERAALGWQTDAAFVLLAKDASGALECVVLAGASHLEAHGRTVLRAAHGLDFLEWRPGDATPSVEHWDLAALTAPRVA